DITSPVCQRCAACCRIRLPIARATSRYRMFLRQTGFAVSPPANEDGSDCCEKPHDIEIDMGYCKHLTQFVSGGEIRYECSVYNSSALPQLCRDYNCVSWAKANDGYNRKNNYLVSAENAQMKVKVLMSAKAQSAQVISSEPFALEQSASEGHLSDEGITQGYLSP